MTNKTINGVPRELIQEAYNELACWKSPVAGRLRALLAAPSCKTCQGDGYVGRLLDMHSCPDCDAPDPIVEADESITIEAVAVVRENDDGLYLDWTLEGGISALECAGVVLFACPEANDMCDESGSAELYPADQLVALQSTITRLESEAFYAAAGFQAAKEEIAQLKAENERLRGEPEKYDEVLLPFLALMRAELHANAHKGDRPGWLQMDRKTAILEVFYHLGKLHQAVHRGEEVAIKEYAADVANMCMMLLDVCACLDEVRRMNP